MVKINNNLQNNRLYSSIALDQISIMFSGRIQFFHFTLYVKNNYCELKCFPKLSMTFFNVNFQKAKSCDSRR